LWDELPFMAQTFSKIYFIPENGVNSIKPLPDNCEILTAPNLQDLKISVGGRFLSMRWVLSDLFSLLRKGLVTKLFRYNFALLSNNLKLATYFSKEINKKSNGGKTFLYSYWTNDLASIAAFIKKDAPQMTAFSRAHGFDVFEEQTRFDFIPFRKLQLHYLNAVFSVSQRGRSHLQNLNRTYSNKIKAAYLGTNDHGIEPFNKEKNTIVSCAFLRRLKGVEFIPEVLMHVQNKIKWVHIGGGELMNEIKEKCKKLPANIEVELLGDLSQKEIFDFYKKNSVSLFLSLSEREGLPVSLMEAISFGIPIMATDVGGCKEIANQNTGVLLPKLFDKKNVAKEIDSFLTSEKNNDKFRAGVRLFWETNFSASKNYNNFYKQVLDL
jgi:glycosyltransferase involved in cell wall biosynthesis